MLELLATGAGPAAAEHEPRPGFLARLFTSQVGRARVRGEEDIARLGLTTTQHAEERYRAARAVPDLVGSTVLRGERFGREVEVTIDPDRYRTRLERVSVPKFHVRSEDGQLRASERSPAELHGALAGLARDRRWEGVEAKGGPEGITVFHRLSGGRSAGTQGYLDDLWLAESLAELLASP